jgi:hypothetical protein
MKKIIYFFLIFLCISFQVSAINGDGSYPSPYNGALTTDMVWTGTVYVNGDVTVDGYTLTVSAGSTIVFLSTSADLIITGTGVLSAVGSNVSMIRFTADSDNTGTFGGPGERWGHISFQNMTSGFATPSIIDFCIIEFGSKNSSPFNFESAGGGLQTTYSNLTISNSIIRNNYAGWGGGIYVNANASPSISNCIISNNTAGTTGGGISVYQYSAAVITNSIIMNNSCTGGGGGGGIFIGDYPDNVRIYNCVITSNTSTINPSNNIRIWKSAASTGPKFYNTIVWGSGNNSINYLQIGASTTDFNYCSIQGYSTGYTNCININGTNNDPAGPNFYNVTPGSEDYRINFISPCRDAGTSSGAPLTDYLGKGRIGPYDIGAYEVQYSSWKTNATTTDWSNASNWNGLVPSTAQVVYIPSGASNYPTNPPADFTINTGNELILAPGAKATFGTLSNSGTLKLASDATNISSLKVDTYSGNDASIELFLAGGEAGTKNYRWHYISSPVTSLASSIFAPTPTLNLAQYVSNRPSSDALQGWVAYDGYVYFGGGSDIPNAFSSLSVGKGYNYYYTADYKFTFTGQLNTSTVNASLAYTSGNDALYGFNLLGNPFSCGLDWSQIIADGTFPANTSKGIYFTRDNVQCSYIGGVGIPGDVTAIIPPMQGFFTKTYSSSNSINLLASAKVQNGIHSRYKGSEIIPLVRLSLTENSVTDETVVRFDATAKTGFDYDFDALKMFIPDNGPAIYSAQSGTNYSINGQPFPDQIVDIPIVLILGTDGTHKISATQLQGLDSYPVTLIDNTTGFMADLKTTPELTFNSSAGKIADRFILKVGNVLTGTENPVVSKTVFNIYNGNNLINIQTASDDWDGKSGSVKVLDLTGKTISDRQNVEFSKNSLVQVQAPAGTGLYVVEIKSGLKRYVGKVVVK